jgi:uncharacterized protein YneF (UPF0154 family)
MIEYLAVFLLAGLISAGFWITRRLMDNNPPEGYPPKYSPYASG